MKRKKWNMTIVDNPNLVVISESDEFYTTDTEAFLVFELRDKNFNPTRATITLHNRMDGSVVNEDVDVIDGVIEYEMRHEVIEHAGSWRAQLVYEQDKDGVPEKYTSQVVEFNVTGHLLDTKETALVAIKNWDNFVLTAEGTMERWESLEAIRQENENQRVAAETARQTNYLELVETGAVRAGIDQALAQHEQTYAPRLTSLEQNDADLTAQLAHTVKRNENESIGMEMFKPEVKQALNDGEWNVNVNTSEIENGAVTIEKLAPQLQGIFIEEGKNWGFNNGFRN